MLAQAQSLTHLFGGVERRFLIRSTVNGMQLQLIDKCYFLCDFLQKFVLAKCFSNEIDKHIEIVRLECN